MRSGAAQDRRAPTPHADRLSRPHRPAAARDVVNNATTARHVFSLTISQCADQRQPWLMHALLLWDEGHVITQALYYVALHKS
jgi:hypothetical protein